MLTTAAPTGATISAQDHIMDQPSSWQQGKQGPPKHFGRQHWKNKPAPASVMANGICRDWWAKAQCLNFRNGQACSDSHPEFIQYEGSDQITRMPDTQRCSNYFSKRTCERGDEWHSVCTVFALKIKGCFSSKHRRPGTTRRRRSNGSGRAWSYSHPRQR
jgi:hypothetical protein